MKQISDLQHRVLQFFRNSRDQTEPKLLRHDADQKFKNSIRRLVQKRKLELVKTDEQGEWYKLT